MNAKRWGALGLTLLTIGTAALAEQPEIAYRILSGYVERKETSEDQGRKVAGSIVGSLGGLALAGSATVWFAGDEISRNFTGAPMNQDDRLGLTIGLGIGGAAMTATGAALLAMKTPDYRAEYAEVFQERDAQVREAMSVAVLRDLAYRAEKARVTGAISSLLVPVISAAIRVGINLSKNEPWHEGVASSISWSAWSIAGGISSLFGTSEEERLYAKYLAGRDALYGDRGLGD